MKSDEELFSEIRERAVYWMQAEDVCTSSDNAARFCAMAAYIKALEQQAAALREENKSLRSESQFIEEAADWKAKYDAVYLENEKLKADLDSACREAERRGSDAACIRCVEMFKEQCQVATKSGSRVIAAVLEAVVYELEEMIKAKGESK